MSGGQVAKIAAIPLGVGVILGLACVWAAGISLGLFIGGLGMVVIAGPSLTMREKGLLGRVIAMGAIVDGIAIVWLAAVVRGPVSVWEWIQCYVVLASVATFLLGLMGMCDKVGLGEVGASAIGVVVGLLWLAWPIWLSAAIEGKAGQRVAGWLVEVGPIYAINSVLSELGIWTERAIAYRLTNLNQTVPYQLPRSIWPSATFHLLIGGALIYLGSRSGRRE